MDERLVALIKGLLPPGSEVVKIYKEGDQVKVDVDMPGMGGMTCALKKNHAGDFYLD